MSRAPAGSWPRGRNATLDFHDLRKLGVVLKRAQYFIVCKGKYPYGLKITESAILRAMLSAEGVETARLQGPPEQLSLFPAPAQSSLPTKGLWDEQGSCFTFTMEALTTCYAVCLKAMKTGEADFVLLMTSHRGNPLFRQKNDRDGCPSCGSAPPGNPAKIGPEALDFVRRALSLTLPTGRALLITGIFASRLYPMVQRRCVC